MGQNLEKILESLGLNPKEAKTYLALLALKEAYPSIISRKSGIKRPTTYVILNELTRKGLVSHVKKQSGTLYRAINPRQLLEKEKNKVNILEDVIPELVGLGSKYEATPQMSIYEGEKGIIQIMEDTLTTKEPLLCWCDVDMATKTVLTDYFPYYLKKKIQKKIWLKGIFTYNTAGLRHKKNEKKELREVYLVPKEKFPFKNEINIYDDKVAIISHQDEIGVIIQNQNIADSQKAIFHLAFEYAKILEKNVLTKQDIAYLKGK